MTAAPPLETRSLPARFMTELEALPLAGILAQAERLGSREDLRATLEAPDLTMPEIAALLDREVGVPLEEILDRARYLTDRTFGRSILMYAPCYLSSFCVNHCVYCGFNFTMEIPRRQISAREAAGEIRLLASRGMKRVLLVAGDYPGKVTPEYIEEVVTLAREIVPEVDLELAPTRTGVYRGWAEAGAGGVTCYQETYNPFRYEELHPRGPKTWYEHRLGALERAAAAGMIRLGLGVLLGLADPVRELLALIAHARFLARLFPAAHLTVSLPRLRPAVPGFAPPRRVGDEDLVRYYAVLRLALPRTGLVVSTREPAPMRRDLLKAGITQMSAGSVTVPGGYGALEDDGTQFDVADHRCVADVVEDLDRSGYSVRWSTEAAA